jgi:hypothetical protein
MCVVFTLGYMYSNRQGRVVYIQYIYGVYGTAHVLLFAYGMCNVFRSYIYAGVRDTFVFVCVCCGL